MAKNWTIDKESNVMTRTYADKSVSDLTVNPADLFATFNEMEDVQKQTIVNGLKQKLDDSIARSKDEKLNEVEKREVQEALWLRLKNDRKWNAEGSGARGPSVSLKALIPAINEFIQMGYSVEKIAGLIGKPADLVQRYVDEANVEETVEETKE